MAVRRDNLPTKWDLTPAVLQTLAEAGGSLTRQEVKDRAPATAGLSDEQMSVVFDDGQWAGTSVAVSRVGWALSALKAIGAVQNTDRGVWSITPAGRAWLGQDRDNLIRAARDARAEQRRAQGQPAGGTGTEPRSAESELADDGPTDEVDEQTWKADLLHVLTSMRPDRFERLCGRLLREFGCRDVEVTSYSDDEGLDGTGVLEVSLLSFPVFFQAKRYRQDRAVQPAQVREFRGAMAQRGDKGIFITTGVFTERARDEAKRGGAPIDLIDGDRLCELLRERELGVYLRPVVDPAFFDAL